MTLRASEIRSRLATGGATHPVLSPREFEVAKLVGEGLTNKQIAKTLYLSERTAQNHVQHILTKLGSQTVPRSPRGREMPFARLLPRPNRADE